jgi:hypothetical protein
LGAGGDGGDQPGGGGPWQPPERGRWIGDAKVALLASALYALIVGIHHWLDRPVLLFL